MGSTVHVLHVNDVRHAHVSITMDTRVSFLSIFISMCLFCMEAAIAHGSITIDSQILSASFSLSLSQTHRHISPYGFSLKSKFLQYCTDFDWLRFTSSGTSSPTISLIFCFYMLFFVLGLGFGWFWLNWIALVSNLILVVVCFLFNQHKLLCFIVHVQPLKLWFLVSLYVNFDLLSCNSCF